MASNVLYAIACVLVPVAWGLLIVRFVGTIEKWMGKKPATEVASPLAHDDQP